MSGTNRAAFRTKTITGSGVAREWSEGAIPPLVIFIIDFEIFSKSEVKSVCVCGGGGGGG